MEKNIFLLLVAIALFFTIRVWKKGTLWSNNISSALGGAVIGVVLVLLITLYFFLTLEGAILLIVGYGAFFGIPIFAILGAIIFGIIGSTKRKNAPVIDHKSSPTTSPSIDYESLLITSNGNLNRPLFVNGLTILVAINILYALVTLLGVVGLNPLNAIRLGVFPDLDIHLGFIDSRFYPIIIASIISQIVFLTRFFNLKRSSLKWLNISIGLEILIKVLNFQFMYFQFIGLAITAVVWWLVWDYISHRNTEGHRIFN